MKNPLIFLPLFLALMPVICKVDGKSIGESVHDADILTKEGQPGWIEEVLKQAKSQSRKRGGHVEDGVAPEIAKSRHGPSYSNDADILTSEGQPGWIEEVLEEANSQPVKNEEAVEVQRQQKREEDEPIPEEVVTELETGLKKLGDKATGALKGLAKIRQKWSGYSVADRAVMVQTLQAATENFGQILNVNEDPLGAIQGGVNMIAKFAALAGPKGQLISESLAFASGLLSLFGEEEKSVGEIVREQIDEALGKFHQKDLSNQAQGIASTFDVSKAYVDHLAQKGEKLTVVQAGSLERNVPLYLGLKFMGTLANEIESLVKANEGKNARKALTYIELYAKMAVLKDMIMFEAAGLLPDELEPNREALLVAQKYLRDQQKKILKFLYETDVTNNIMPYYDPDIYQITDSYLSTLLGVENYDRSLAGTWCLTPNIGGGGMKPLVWSRKEPLVVFGLYPYITTGSEGCIWKLIPHGKSIFTIQNTFKCPGYDFCGHYLAYDSLGWPNKANSRADLKDMPMLWEISGNNQKRIRSKYSCGSSNPKWCDTQMRPVDDKWDVTTFELTKDNVGYIWFITKEPKNG